MGGESYIKNLSLTSPGNCQGQQYKKHRIKAVGAHRVNGESLNSRDRSKMEVRISQTSGCRGVGEGGVENHSDFRAG